MSENKKNKNKNTKEILKKSFDLYKNFLDNPTKKNLNAFMEVAENYKEAFIEDTSDFVSTSSKDLEIFSKVQRSSVSEKYSSEDRLMQRRLSLFDRKLQKWEEGGKQLKENQILNRLIRDHSMKLLDPIQNSSSIARDKILADAPHRAVTYAGKGPVKLFSDYVNIPNSTLKALDLDIPGDLTFLEFRIAKYRYVNERDETTANQWVRPFPRRWYMEKDKHKGRTPWYEDRADIQPLLREFLQWKPMIINGQKAEEFFNDKDNGSAEFYNSEDLSSIARHEIFHDYCLNEDEFLELIDEDNNYKFLLCDSIQNRTPNQILANKEVRWRDICFYNDSHLTIRSFTNDMDFMPRCRDYIPAKNIPGYEQKSKWVMSNEMPKLSYPVISYFCKVLEKDFLENSVDKNGMNRKEKIYDLFQNPPEELGQLSMDEIAGALRLDPSYVKDVLDEILKEKKGEQ